LDRAEVRKAPGAAADVIRIQYGGSVTAANAKEILGLNPPASIQGDQKACGTNPFRLGVIDSHRPMQRNTQHLRRRTIRGSVLTCVQKPRG